MHPEPPEVIAPPGSSRFMADTESFGDIFEPAKARKRKAVEALVPVFLALKFNESDWERNSGRFANYIGRRGGRAGGAGAAEESEFARHLRENPDAGRRREGGGSLLVPGVRYDRATPGSFIKHPGPTNSDRPDIGEPIGPKAPSGIGREVIRRRHLAELEEQRRNAPPPTPEAGFAAGRFKDSADFVRNATAADFEEIYSVPGGLVAKVVSERRTPRSLYKEGDRDVRVTLALYRPGDPIRVGEIERRFQDDGRVHHTSFTLHADVQGAGTAARMNQRAEDYYRSAGFKDVGLMADMDVGKYAWAQQGYDFLDVSDPAFAESRSLRLNRYRQEAANLGLKQREIDQLLPRDIAGLPSNLQKPIHAWDIATLDNGKKYTVTTDKGKVEAHLGKALMLNGPAWGGIKSLDQTTPGGAIGEAYFAKKTRDPIARRLRGEKAATPDRMLYVEVEFPDTIDPALEIDWEIGDDESWFFRAVQKERAKFNEADWVRNAGQFADFVGGGEGSGGGAGASDPIAGMPNAKIDLLNVPEAQAREIRGELERLAAKYPQVAEHFTYVGSGRWAGEGSNLGLSGVNADEQVRKGRRGSKVQPGDIKVLGLSMRLNPLYLGAVEGLAAPTLTADAPNMVGGRLTLTTTVTHEFGHGVDSYLTQVGRGLPGERLPSIHDLPLEGVSRYARADNGVLATPREKFAEAFSAHEQGLLPDHPDVQKVVEYMEAGGLSPRAESQKFNEADWERNSGRFARFVGGGDAGGGGGGGGVKEEVASLLDKALNEGFKDKFGGLNTTPQERREKFLKEATRSDIEEIYSVPDGYRAHVTYFSRESGELAVSMDLYDVYDEQDIWVGNMDRVFAANSVHHSLFSLSPRQQGQGTAARINQRAEEYYRSAGYEKITLLADMTAGKYAWARQGYDFNDPDTAAGQRQAVTRQNDLRDRYMALADVSVEEARRVIPFASDRVMPAWEVAALDDGKKYGILRPNEYVFSPKYATSPKVNHIGKSLLLGGEAWDGVKDISYGAPSRIVGDAYFAEKAK